MEQASLDQVVYISFCSPRRPNFTQLEIRSLNYYNQYLQKENYSAPNKSYSVPFSHSLLLSPVSMNRNIHRPKMYLSLSLLWKLNWRIGIFKRKTPTHGAQTMDRILVPGTSSCTLIQSLQAHFFSKYLRLKPPTKNCDCFGLKFSQKPSLFGRLGFYGSSFFR